LVNPIAPESNAKRFGKASSMRRTIEILFELVETNVPCAVFAVTASFAITGCLRFIWE
jgi:hypothetical protein